MGIVVRGVGEDEVDGHTRAIFHAFGQHPTDEEVADEAGLVEVDRLLAAVDGGQVVGTAGAYSFEMTLPGGTTTPVAGVTSVGVLPTHRRRGVLRSMMAAQLDDVADRGEVVAVLTASEAGIYGRFGYGLATRLAKVDIDTRGGLDLVVEPRTGGSLRLVVDAEVHSALAAPVYDEVRHHRVGELSRSQAWWDLLQRDREKWRDGASARFCVVHEDDAGAVDGYCWYRVKQVDGGDAIGRNEVQIWDLAAVDPEVEAALLVYLAGIDLTRSITGWVRPVDDPWPLRITDVRRYRTQLVHDHLYVRVLDVPAALAARTYEAAGALLLAVDDRSRPAAGGRFRLEVDDDGTAICERVGDTARGRADVRLDAAALGSLYLGDVAPSVLAAAGRLVPGSPDALRLADRAFRTGRAPFCTMEF
jgi:predicted acetyltransferase